MGPVKPSVGPNGTSNNGLQSASKKSVPEARESGRSSVDSTMGRLEDNILSWFNKRNGDTLKCARAFVPWVLQQAYFDGGMNANEIFIHKGCGAVVCSDAKGFTELTEGLSKKSNGAELLSHCLTTFFTILIDLINNYRGDVIKFSGDALMIYFQAVDDTKSPKYNRIVPPHGTYGLPDLGAMATSVVRASACCIEIHKRLHMFDTGVDKVRLSLHIAIGCGPVSILQVGGVVPPETHVPRCEYIIAGPPLEQISHAEPLAENGETCLSPQAWEYVKGCVVEGKRIEEAPEYHLLERMDESKYTFPTVKHAAMENDNRMEKQFRLSELNIIRKFIPTAVYKQIECGTLPYVNEMRRISIIFISGSGLDVTTERGANIAQELVTSVQRACYQHEGTMNKFVIDDKGMLFLIVFGLPPLVHPDDPTRAVLACFDFVKVFERLDLVGKFGVTTGRSYCGVVGSARRMEYTVLGDCVNLSARLMMQAPRLGILCDIETKNSCSNEVIFNALAPVKVKGKREAIPLFQPVKKESPINIGIAQGTRKIMFPWYDHPFGGAILNNGKSAMQSNVTNLCGVKTWGGIIKVQEMLGGNFQGKMHHGDVIVNLGAQKVPPPDGIMKDGGFIVIEGPSGMGKLELAEHIVVHASSRFQMLPAFGTMGPRPGDSVRFAVEIVRSTLGIFRCLASDPATAANNQPLHDEDDFQALMKVVPKEYQGSLFVLKEPLNDQQRVSNSKSSDILEASLGIVSVLLKALIKKVPVLLVLTYQFGTSLFPKALEDGAIFWRAVTTLYNNLADSMKSDQKMVIAITCRDSDETNPAVKAAKAANAFLQLSGLSEENLLEYMSNYLKVKEEMVPQPLRQFVAKVTLGNPLYIRETIDQLLENHIQINMGANRQPRSLECKDLDKIAIISWQHTAMVGNTFCQLESLDPLEAAVLKMSTCFVGSFTLADIAASICSRWALATHFDFLRVFNALRRLVEQKVIETVDAPPGENGRVSSSTQAARAFGSIQYFQMHNLLIRAVGSSMVLEAQKKSVKRQALIDRALSRELPARMEVLASKRNVQHIPWYYEQAFRRM